MADFKRQRIAGDGVSGADMLTHVNADDPHPQYSKSLEVASTDALMAHINAEVPHTTVILKADVITDYNNPANADKVVAASAIRDINARLTIVSNGAATTTSQYSTHRIDGTSLTLLGNNSSLDSTNIVTSSHKDISTDVSRDLGYYIYNGELFDTLNKKYTLSHLNLTTGIWSKLHRDYVRQNAWVAINDSKLFFKTNNTINSNTSGDSSDVPSVSIDNAIVADDTTYSVTVPKNVSSISSGWGHNAAIDTAGKLWTWGDNTFGQLGLGHTVDKYTPQPVGTATNWVSVSCGYQYTMAINAKGELWAWGRNTSDQLGIGHKAAQSTPQPVGTATNWSSVACGNDHTVAINAKGELWAWGYNGYGQLGIGHKAAQSTPHKVGTDTNWVSVACGYAHTVAIKSNGQLWAWGDNYYSQLGLGDGVGNQTTPQPVGTATNWVSVACGYYHTLAINANGALLAWGNNGYGQLGLGHNTNQTTPQPVGTATNWVSVACGVEHTLAIDIDGTLYSFGNNQSGELGINEAGLSTSKDSPQLVNHPENKTYKQIACGDYTSIAIDVDNKLYLWGRFVANTGGSTLAFNFFKVPTPILPSNKTWGVSGTKEYKYSTTISSSGNTSFVLDAAGKLWSWGGNNYGQAGIGVTQVFHTPQRIGSASNWVQVAGSNTTETPIRTYTAAIDNTGKLWTWGYGAYGQLGLGTSGSGIFEVSPKQVGTKTWKYVSCGTLHTAAIDTDNKLWVWGYNGSGQLGFDNTSTTIYTTPQLVLADKTWKYVACSYAYTVAIDTNNKLWGWGSNYKGCLGIDITNNQVVSPQQLNNLNWRQVSCGLYYTAAIDENDNLYTWGSNDNGQLGLGSNSSDSYYVPQKVNANRWKTVSCGLYHALAIDTNNKLWAWGLNDNGQLGLGNTSTQYAPKQVGSVSNWAHVSAGSTSTLAITTENVVYNWGTGYGVLNNVQLLTPTKAVIVISDTIVSNRYDMYSSEFSQIKFNNANYNTGWLDAIIVSTSPGISTDNYASNAGPVALIGTRADGIYLSILYFENATATYGGINIPALNTAIADSIKSSNIATIPVEPQKLHYLAGTTKIPFSSCKQLLSAVENTNGLGGILTNDGKLYKIPFVPYNSEDPVAEAKLSGIQEVIEAFNNPIAINESGKINVLDKEFDIQKTISLIGAICTRISSNQFNTSDTRYTIADGRLFKLIINGSYTEVLSNSAQSGRWTAVTQGPRYTIGTNSNTPSAYAINDGNLYQIIDTTATQLTNSKDYSDLLGGGDICVVIQRNGTTVGMPDGVLTTANIVTDYITDPTKIISADILSAFREEYLLHDHDDRNDGLYLSKDHIDITKIDNPHSQYVLTRDLITAGVFVKDPLENSVAVFTSPDVAVDSSTLTISMDTESCTATIVNNNAVGTARVWNSILNYDLAYSGKIVSRNSNGTFDRTAIEDTTTSTIGTDDTYNPCSFFIQNGKLYNTAIAVGASADSPISPTLINNPGGATGIWTKVSGMTFRTGYSAGSGQLSAGVGIFNNKAYIILSDGTVVPVPSSPTGNWSMLVGSLIYSNVSTSNLVGAVWGICDGELYMLGTGAVVGTAGIAYKVTSTAYPDITNWTMVNTKSRSGVGAVGISSGRIYRIGASMASGSYVFTITEEASEYTDFEQVYLTDAGNVLLTRRSNGLAYFFNNILTPDVANHPLGWTQLIAGYGIYNSGLYRIIYNASGVSSIVPVTINGISTSGWTSITGSQRYGGQAISYGTNINMMYMYPVGICNGKAYIIENSTATLLSEPSDTISDVYGSIIVPNHASTYKIPAVLVTEVPSSIELSAKNASYANKWVISKTINNIKTPLSISNESALTVEPWLATWTTPNAYVTLDLSVNGYWKSVPVANLVQDATQVAKGVSKPAEDGGLSIIDGNLSVAPEVARIQDLKIGTVPVYGYLSQNDDIIISSGLDYKPYLKKTNMDAVDTARVWQNYDAYGANKVGIINNTTLNIMDLGLSITSTAESNDSSVACNYTIINGRLFYIVNPDTVSQIGSDTTWSKVTGIYQALANNIYTYAYGISNGRLYKIAEGVVTNLNNNTTGWTDICGYSSNNATNFYAYAIRNGTLYYISNATVTAVTGITGTWSKISGIGGTYNGHVCTAYGIVYNSTLGTVLCKLATNAVQVPGSTANNWTALTGYTHLNSIAYAVQNGYLYKITPFSIIPIESTPNWTKLSGLGYASSGCCYGLCGTSLYAIKDTVVEQVGSDVGWTDICGDYSNAFRRYGYGINRGHIYRLYDRYATKLTKDSGWSNIHGRSDVVDYVVCSKLSEHQYRLIADDASGSWLLQEYSNGSYTTIATSYEPASGTDPWNCSWDNEVIVLDVLSHTGWTSVPLSELGGGGSGTVSWVRVQ